MKRVLRFTADWCGPCKMLAKNLEDVRMSPMIPIEVVDIDIGRKTRGRTSSRDDLRDCIKIHEAPLI